VIGRDGKLVFQVAFPARTFLAGFGANAIYAVQLDEDEVQHLQRFRLPATGR
jgi:hypothetical protein